MLGKIPLSDNEINEGLRKSLVALGDNEINEGLRKLGKIPLSDIPLVIMKSTKVYVS